MTSEPTPSAEPAPIAANIVVGSGPVGVCVASALMDAGQQVILIDVGRGCEEDRLSLARQLRGQPPEAWSPAAVAELRGSAAWDPALPKRIFGSDFPYALDELPAAAQRGTRCLVSFARGGLSNVWGASVLPSHPRDIEDWPLQYDELRPHFEAVTQLLRVAAASDDLEGLLPLYGAAEPPPPISMQATAVLTRLESHRADLRRQGIWFGGSRLALRTRDTNSGPGCLSCGLCLSGCPYGAIWNAADSLDELCARGLDYRPGLIATHLESGSEVAAVSVREVSGGRSATLRARRIFVACGPLSSARLVADSLGLYATPLPVRYQPYMLIPLLGFKAARNVERERLHTLAQLYLEFDDAALSSHLVHLQLYTFNDVMAARVRQLLPRALVDSALRHSLLGRLMAIQAYLHSAEGGELQLECHADPVAGRARLALTAGSQDGARQVFRRLTSRLFRLSARLGAVPLAPMAHLGEPGEGNHVGGTFPMRRNPRRLETDRLGQLGELARIHLVDASVLPSLAATTFTYTVMANAHRIATEVAALQGR